MRMTTQDQLGRTVEITGKPHKLISLVPSITELLFDLGLGEFIRGRTKYCIHPEEKTGEVPTVGGVMGLDYHQIEQIKPDVIFASREENSQNEIDEIAKEFPVWVSDVQNLTDALEMIQTIGKICEVEETAKNMVQNIRDNFNLLSDIPEGVIRAVYLIWKHPLYTISKQTFIHDMLGKSGIENVFGDKEKAYPTVTEKEIKDRKPDYILLPSEPYNFTENDVAEFAEKFPNAEIKRVDGEFFSWYGSHLVNAPSYFKQIL